MTIREIMTLAPVIPVLSIENEQHAVPLAQALVAGGLKALEITLRTPAALAAIKAIATNVKDAVVGVGTVARPEDLHQAIDAGARFAVSPGLTTALIEAAHAYHLPFLPGVMTPSELLYARAAGFTALKLFPAQAAGGVTMLKSLAGPFPDVVFCPTGGVTPENMGEFLALGNVLCVGGSWVAPPAAIAAGDWETISELARKACAWQS